MSLIEEIYAYRYVHGQSQFRLCQKQKLFGIFTNFFFRKITRGLAKNVSGRKHLFGRAQKPPCSEILSRPPISDPFFSKTWSNTYASTYLNTTYVAKLTWPIGLIWQSMFKFEECFSKKMFFFWTWHLKTKANKFQTLCPE
jgi:hypothetical protein